MARFGYLAKISFALLLTALAAADPATALPTAPLPDDSISSLVRERRGATLYSITVIDGYADQEFAASGQRVYIRAIYPSNYYGWHFDMWGSMAGGVIFAHKYDMRTSFIMPSAPVTVRAYFRRDSWDHGFLAVGGGCTAGAVLPIFCVLTACIVVRHKR